MGGAMKSTATVSVPATSGNVGPGFDSHGLALELRDTVTVTLHDQPGIQVKISGEGADSLPTDESHLVAQVFLTAVQQLGGTVTGFELNCVNNIPQGRGLGSSAAAIVAGLSLAQLIVRGDIDRDWVLQEATTFEGHPDNVAACVFGGFTISWISDSVHARSLNVIADVIPIVGVPQNELSTEKARGLLPTEVSLVDASFNLARASLMVTGLTTDSSVLFDATDDRLHQPFRRSAYTESLALVEKLREADIPACISGAGPSVLAFANEQTRNNAIQIIESSKFSALALDIAHDGVVAK